MTTDELEQFNDRMGGNLDLFNALEAENKIIKDDGSINQELRELLESESKANGF